MGCLFESFGKLLDGSVIEESSEFYNSIENSITWIGMFWDVALLEILRIFLLNAVACL